LPLKVTEIELSKKHSKQKVTVWMVLDGFLAKNKQNQFWWT